MKTIKLIIYFFILMSVILIGIDLFLSESLSFIKLLSSSVTTITLVYFFIHLYYYNSLEKIVNYNKLISAYDGVRYKLDKATTLFASKLSERIIDEVIKELNEKNN